MNQNDLYIEYARVIELCKATALENTPWVCVKFNGDEFYDHPRFDMPPENYQFTIAILEDRPVFVGDTLYDREGNAFKVTEDCVSIGRMITLCSWQPPKPKRRIVLEETGDIRCVKKGEYAEEFNAPPASLPSIFMWSCDFSSPSKYKIWRIVEDTGNKP